MAPARQVLLLGACIVTIAGCGVSDPYQPHHPAPSATTASRLTASPTPTSIAAGGAASQPAAQPAPGEHDGPPTPQAHLAPGASSRTPQAALARFAQLYVNWSAGQLPQRARQLAALSTGQAHAQALRLGDRGRVLERYQVTNSGTVVAIAAAQGAEQGRWAVVTNELTSGAGPYLGLPATSHVSWATLTRQQGGYVITGWYPAS